MQSILTFMQPVFTVSIWIFLILGTALSFVGVIGFLRLPDVYTRLHATGKVSVLGLVFLLLAAILMDPARIAWKALLLMLFVLLSVPSISHSIASAAYRNGIKMDNPSRDDLAEKLSQKK